MKMDNLIQMLLSIKNPENHFIERPELIQGYTEDEIKQIEQKYNFPVHGQFKELLMTMGKCSGGLLFGEDIYIYKSGVEYYFGESSRVELINDQDCQAFICAVGDVVKRKIITVAGINENIVSYFMFASDDNDMVYEWDENEETLKEFGTLFDFLKYYRQITICPITGESNNDFKELTTGRLL
ncbi:SMI1/KNR4 family protein [Conchiformibius steedae DSM 2580]|uniref:SMI1/KNR4 family protein n=1 Tax=Conchiformibius steedae DSM 2580 TaxID=1121352 RepID=A0AAE9L032_9NEIS|nr:SMI1/KNR4 family protein [Conchiformibius steedae]URD67674.1 SMI1/KNR4 family protein [Conchiformibius steedae DSM 2580]